MSFLALTGIRKDLRRPRGRQGLQSRRRARRVRHLPRTKRLRQDDDAAHDRRLRDADRGRNPHQRPGRHASAPQQARDRHGVPVLRAVPQHDGRRQHRLRPQGRAQACGRDQGAGRRDAGDDQAAAARRALSLSTVGRPAAARLARPRARAEPADSAARRAAVRPRRAHPRVAARGNPRAATQARASPRSSSPTTRRKRCRCPTASS